MARLKPKQLQGVITNPHTGSLVLKQGQVGVPALIVSGSMEISDDIVDAIVQKASLKIKNIGTFKDGETIDAGGFFD